MPCRAAAVATVVGRLRSAVAVNLLARNSTVTTVSYEVGVVCGSVTLNLTDAALYVRFFPFSLSSNPLTADPGRQSHR